MPSRRVNASCVGVVPTASKTARGKTKSRANGGQKTWVATVRLCVTRLRVAVVAGKEIIVVLKRLQIVDAMGQSTDDRGVVRLLNEWAAHDLARMSLHIDASKTLTGLCIHAGHGLIASRHARQKAIIRLHHRLNVSNLLRRQTKAGRRAAVVFTYATTAIAFIWSCWSCGLSTLCFCGLSALFFCTSLCFCTSLFFCARPWLRAVNDVSNAGQNAGTKTHDVAHKGAGANRRFCSGIGPTHTTQFTGTKAGRRRAHIWDARRGRRSRRRSRARRGCGRRCA